MATVIPVDVTEALMGHEGYLTEVYRRYSLEDLAKYYKQGEHTLLVFAQAEEISKLKLEIEERNKQLQTLINGLAAENMTLKTQIKTFNEKLERLENALRLALTSPTKQFTQEAIDDILEGKGLAEKLPKKYVAEA
jgi:DNA repair exonuclease SbcCD ATPase subunit